MANIKDIEGRLKEIGCNFRFWGHAELKELANILLPGEIIEHCINGQYEGGFALLVATDQRVLLIDKKPMYLTLEDIRYDMIAEVDYYHRLVNASVFIMTPNKSLRFMAYNNTRLRKLFHFVQQRVMEIRQHYQQVQKVQQRYEEAQLEQMHTGYPSPQQQQPYFEQQIDQRAAQYQPSAHSPQATSMAPPMRPAGMSVVPPIISAYTRLPIRSRQRRFLGSRALNSPMPSMHQSQQPQQP